MNRPSNSHPRLDAIVRLFAGDDPPGPRKWAELRQRFFDFQSIDHRDLPAFWDILEQTVLSSGWTPPDVDSFRLLVTACGRCEEAVTLASFFSGFQHDGIGRPVDITGVDVRENSLEKARRRCHSTRVLFANGLGRDPQELRHRRFAFRFLCLDATQLEQRPEFEDPFHLLLFRHQNMYQGMGLWTKIFEQSLTRLHPDGLILITSYYDEEHKRALDVLNALGMRLLVSLKNPNSRRLKREGQSMDRHVAAYAPHSSKGGLGGVNTASSNPPILIPGHRR